MPRLFNLKYKELFVCLGFIFIAFAYPWIFQTYLINTGIVGIDMVIPLMSSAILITITPVYFQFYKHTKGYGLGERRIDLFIVFMSLILSVQFMMFRYQSSYIQSPPLDINIILVINIIAVVILAPLYEEIIFRGVVYGFFKNTLMCSTGFVE